MNILLSVESYGEARSLAGYAFYRDFSVMILDYTITYRQAETGSLAGNFGGEKWIEYFLGRTG
jgi:hypothetical protein